MENMIRDSFSILMADDEALSRKVIENKLMTMPDVSVTGVSNGHLAKQYLLDHFVDLVITDIRMPVLDGLELAEFISRFSPETMVIIISGYSEFDYAKLAIQYGVKDYLLKPVQLQNIEKIVLECKQKSFQNHQLTIHQHYHKDADQEKLIAEILKENSSSCGMEELEHLFSCQGTVVSVTPDVDDKINKEEFELTYKNLIGRCLHDYAVLSLGNQNGSFRFLLIPGNNPDHRNVEAAGEYLNRVLNHQVEFTTLASISSIGELRGLDLSGSTDVSSQVIESACQFMKEHLGEPISRNMVAEYVYLSHSHFGHLFRQVKGMGYNAYLTQIRIEQAKKLLLNNMTVGDVAVAVGYRDAKYFSEIFYQKTGCIPSDYKFMTLGGEIPHDTEE